MEGVLQCAFLLEGVQSPKTRANHGDKGSIVSVDAAVEMLAISAKALPFALASVLKHDEANYIV